MRPSQSIRLGCLYVPEQCRQRFFSGNDGDVVPYAACAIGAMAYGFDPDCEWDGFDAGVYPRWMGEFLFRGIEPAQIPRAIEKIPTDRPAPVFEDVLIHLNDRLRWTREGIADWLESLGY